MSRKHFAGNLFRHFEGELEMGGRLAEQLPPEFRSGELVECEVAAHGGEGFGVLVQALALKEPGREVPARQITLARVNLPQPALILPGAAADQNVLRGKRTQAPSETGAVEAGRVLEQRPYHARAESVSAAALSFTMVHCKWKRPGSTRDGRFPVV